MVDYSKWDRMDFSDSDSDDDGSGPRVTSLEQPGKVTIGSDGNLEIGQSSLPAQTRTQSLASLQSKSTQGIPTVSGSISGDTVDISSQSTLPPTDTLDNKQKNEEQQWRSQLTHNGGEHYCSITANQSETKLPVYWCQDRYTVTLRVGIPSEIFPTRGIRVRVSGALQYSDRFSAVGSGVMSGYKSQSENAYGSVEIVSISNENQEETVLLAGELPRPIHLNQDEDEIDHEIQDYFGTDEKYNCNKLVTIIMPKAVPMAGMVLWWDCPLVGYPQIDVSMIQDRKPSGRATGEGGGATTEKKKEAFQKAWEEAHTMFREKMKTKEKQSIDIDED